MKNILRKDIQSFHNKDNQTFLGYHDNLSKDNL